MSPPDGMTASAAPSGRIIFPEAPPKLPIEGTMLRSIGYAVIGRVHCTFAGPPAVAVLKLANGMRRAELLGNLEPALVKPRGQR